jgi:hypothetical protein
VFGMTVKSNTGSSKNQGAKPSGNKNSNQSGKGNSRPSSSSRPSVSHVSGVLVDSQKDKPLVQGSREQAAEEASSAASVVGAREKKSTNAGLSRPVAGRQWNDSRIPSLEDHVRIVQMMHAGDRNLKNAAKDLARRLDVSRKEALAALQACS